MTAKQQEAPETARAAAGKGQDDTFDRPGQLNRDNINPNAKHANPPNPPTGEMLSINEPPGSQLNPAQSAASDEQPKSAAPDRTNGDEDDDDDDNGGGKASKKRSHR